MAALLVRAKGSVDAISRIKCFWNWFCLEYVFCVGAQVVCRL